MIVSGARLDPNFGAALNEIDSDGFEIYQEVKINLDNDDCFQQQKPLEPKEIANVPVICRFFVVYARFEGLAAVIASSQMGIPTAHIEDEI